MCLISFAWRASGRHLLVVAANRDEAHARPTTAAAWWADAPHVLAGRDVTAGGTWLGVDRSGRFAAVTNLRSAGIGTGRLSRGALVADFLRGSASAASYAESVAAGSDAYGEFNLLVFDGAAMWFVGSRSAAHALPPGVHAVSNVEPEVDWPKVARARERIEALVELAEPDARLFRLLAERRSPIDGYDERQVSPFQLDAVWGTRSSTVIVIDADGSARFIERSFDAAGATTGEVRFDFRIDPLR